SIYRTRVLVSMDEASSRDGVFDPVRIDRPAASSPATSYRPLATFLYRQKYRPVDLRHPPRAPAPPDASSAFPKSDPDGPEKSYSDERPHLSTRCATCLRRRIHTARCLSRASNATCFRPVPV